MIPVAVRQDHGVDRLRRRFGNLVKQRLSARECNLSVYYDHAGISDDDSAVPPTAFHPGDVPLERMKNQRSWRRSLCIGNQNHSGQHR